MTIDPTFCGSRFSTGKLLAIEDLTFFLRLLKCKSTDPADVNNYRPIAIATALSKVPEQVLLLRFSMYLWTADSQYGFKQAHWADALKQIEYFYRNQDTPVYMWFLDAKNAFDRESLDTGKETVGQKCAIEYCEIVYLLV